MTCTEFHQAHGGVLNILSYAVVGHSIRVVKPHHLHVGSPVSSIIPQNMVLSPVSYLGVYKGAKRGLKQTTGKIIHKRLRMASLYQCVVLASPNAYSNSQMSAMQSKEHIHIQSSQTQSCWW